MTTEHRTIKTQIAELLSVEFSNSGVVTCPGDQIVVTISYESCQNNFGKVLLQIHRVIDEHYPDRNENLFIVICNDEDSFQNIIKIWKTVADLPR